MAQTMQVYRNSGYLLGLRPERKIQNMNSNLSINEDEWATRGILMPVGVRLCMLQEQDHEQADKPQAGSLSKREYTDGPDLMRKIPISVKGR